MQKVNLAVFLSALLPGAGQFYNRDWVKGILFLIASSVLTEGFMRHISITDILAGNLPVLEKSTLLFLILTLAVAFWSMVDAYRHGKKNSAA